MADPINGSGFPRIPHVASIANLPNTKVAQTIIQQLQKPAVVSVKTSAVTQAAKVAKSSPIKNLPRGSLVDRLV